ncbi:rcc01693 family protein [uncultured Hoeflea sp.]|uniref:rcc01693 family protein n=1 Tax=uncultured Hoeflea sp. TaxID=538666 RepID=UPI00262D1DC5|nr:rcc01693 family protein [uncultured Hoeflea sp.]
MTKPERAFFPWASVIRFGLGRLRLPPEAFWALSLRELMVLLDNQAALDTTTRQGIEALMARFPDDLNQQPAQPGPDDRKHQ